MVIKIISAPAQNGNSPVTIRGFPEPLLDQFDLHIQVLPVPRSQITSGGKGEDSYSMRQKVAVAAEIQTERYKDAGIRFNGGRARSDRSFICL